MSAGLGVYAAIPGGGSLESKDISLMRRALVAGLIGMVKSFVIDVEWWVVEIVVVFFTSLSLPFALLCPCLIL